MVGLVIQVKAKFNAIGIWVRDAKSAEKVEALKEDLRRIMETQADYALDLEVFH